MAAKYVVFSKEAWDKFESEWANPDATPSTSTWPSPIEDAVVIRRQDIFSPPALDAYANSIMVAVEMMKSEGIAPPDRLRSISDYFHEQASMAWQESRKIPD